MASLSATGASAPPYPPLKLSPTQTEDSQLQFYAPQLPENSRYSVSFDAIRRGPDGSLISSIPIALHIITESTPAPLYGSLSREWKERINPAMLKTSFSIREDGRDIVNLIQKSNLPPDEATKLEETSRRAIACYAGSIEARHLPISLQVTQTINGKEGVIAQDISSLSAYFLGLIGSERSGYLSFWPSHSLTSGHWELKQPMVPSENGIIPEPLPFTLKIKRPQLSSRPEKKLYLTIVAKSEVYQVMPKRGPKENPEEEENPLRPTVRTNQIYGSVFPMSQPLENTFQGYCPPYTSTFIVTQTVLDPLSKGTNPRIKEFAINTTGPLTFRNELRRASSKTQATSVWSQEVDGQLVPLIATSSLLADSDYSMNLSPIRSQRKRATTEAPPMSYSLKSETEVPTVRGHSRASSDPESISGRLVDQLAEAMQSSTDSSSHKGSSSESSPKTPTKNPQQK